MLSPLVSHRPFTGRSPRGIDRAVPESLGSRKDSLRPWAPGRGAPPRFATDFSTGYPPCPPSCCTSPTSYICGESVRGPVHAETRGVRARRWWASGEAAGTRRAGPFRKGRAGGSIHSWDERPRDEGDGPKGGVPSQRGGWAARRGRHRRSTVGRQGRVLCERGAAREGTKERRGGG